MNGSMKGGKNEKNPKVALKRINSDVVESKDNERINEYKGN
jgi:hypothetical protein